MKDIRVALAGYGTVGKIRHKCIEESGLARVVAIADQAFTSRDNIHGLLLYDNYREMLHNTNFDVLFVALPNYLSAQVTSEAIAAGVHVFCEKPPAKNPHDFEKVFSARAATPGVHIAYGFNHRHHPSVQDAVRLITSCEMGKVLDLRGVYGKSAMIKYDRTEWRSQRRFSGGGILLDQGIHLVDLMRLMSGELTVQHAIVSNGFWNYDIEDNVYATLSNKSGVVAQLHSSATQWRHKFQLDITLEGGSIALSGILSSTRSYGAEEITVATPVQGEAGNPLLVTTRYGQDTSWQRETTEFLELIALNVPPSPRSADDARKTLDLVFAIYSADPSWHHLYGTDWEPIQTSRASWK